MGHHLNQARRLKSQERFAYRYGAHSEAHRQLRLIDAGARPQDAVEQEFAQTIQHLLGHGAAVNRGTRDRTMNTWSGGFTEHIYILYAMSAGAINLVPWLRTRTE
jgi:hypothetical protein